MEAKKNILTYEGLKKLEDELEDLKVNQRKAVAAKIKEAREHADSVDEDEVDLNRISIGCRVKVLDIE